MTAFLGLMSLCGGIDEATMKALRSFGANLQGKPLKPAMETLSLLDLLEEREKIEPKSCSNSPGLSPLDQALSFSDDFFAFLADEDEFGTVNAETRSKSDSLNEESLREEVSFPSFIRPQDRDLSMQVPCDASTCGCRRASNREHSCNDFCENLGCDKTCGVKAKARKERPAADGIDYDYQVHGPATTDMIPRIRERTNGHCRRNLDWMLD